MPKEALTMSRIARLATDVPAEHAENSRTWAWSPKYAANYIITDVGLCQLEDFSVGARVRRFRSVTPASANLRWLQGIATFAEVNRAWATFKSIANRPNKNGRGVNPPVIGVIW